MSAITRFLPKNHLSYLIGKLVHVRLPRFLSTWIIKTFAKAYHIDLNEAELPVSEYPSLGEFFIRKLKPGLRPIGTTWALHPSDSVVTQAGRIQSGKLIQAKNKTYSVVEFTADQGALKKWDNGVFLTYYLCPTDYHRVHSPVTGVIKKVTHIPGALWPVNAWSTENIHELFSVNERVLVEIETDRGLVGVMFVAATNVGQIILSFDSTIVGNQLLSSAKKIKDYNQTITKGDELGAFRMGSTIVMMYAPGVLTGEKVEALLGQAVQVNSNFI
ncbi:MAG: phosphatidylserine decarboxylase [Bdellovibrionales bacterium RIFCSPHIGHO2_01_FULL_40_29]|nr:MAG: phosphatidylserine decarboxylase [Bdellovibrionales bacterium RIFCSPHIGHO2_01_FULL_40_29]OFZ34217.1 MAG: phosphatidylserine decarboxylase [Bdellovibrionales bacterium RIFCSPHIGHO2_02_FULL_40_15]